MLIDNYINQNFEYEIILCKPDNTQLVVLDEAMNFEYDGKFPTTDEISFDIPYYKIENNQQVINSNYNLVIGDYLILMNQKLDDTIINSKY
ncbi:MAG: hypothetical protein M0Q94_12035, partial [Candidatus Cloacimonetes bacterium]|nr:hypothetical protein [Candidatus Cloacimonadota bacterium]